MHFTSSATEQSSKFWLYNIEQKKIIVHRNKQEINMVAHNITFKLENKSNMALLKNII